MDDVSAALRRAMEPNTHAGPVDIVADVVSRPAHAGTATVHGILTHLRRKGLDCIPEPLGAEAGLETLRFIEGADGGDGWFHQHTDQGVASAARLLRSIHDAGANWIPPADAAWGALSRWPARRWSAVRATPDRGTSSGTTTRPWHRSTGTTSTRLRAWTTSPTHSTGSFPCTAMPTLSRGITSRTSLIAGSGSRCFSVRTATSRRSMSSTP
ncbi:MAG: phosphotransferase [Nocardioides sp.]|nr:phosphotransferase [Nocardioides sp.]